MTKEVYDKISKGLQEALEVARKANPQKIAEDIASVQPMDGCLDAVFKGMRSEEELVKQGYVPLDPATRIMWVKR